MKLLLVLALVATAAYAFDESEFVEQPDDMLLEVRSAVDSMKKKGATEADCKDLAKTSCKEVEKSRSTNQNMLNNLKTGSACPALGQKAVAKAKTHYTNTKNTWNTKKTALTNAKNKRVTFASQRYSSMAPGNCGFVFSSRNYLNAKSALNAAIKAEQVWNGKQAEAYKSWQIAIKNAAKQKRLCHCDAQVTAKKLWSTVGNSKLINKQNRAHQKCKMMTCVLAGTSISSAKCRGSLPALRNKKLTAATNRENCKGHVVNRKSWATLFSANGNNRTYKNSWMGWYHRSHNSNKKYSDMKLDQVEFRCGSTYVKYQLNNGFKGKSLRSIVTGCFLNQNSKNNNSHSWRAGQCPNVGKKIASAGSINGGSLSNLRIGVGDGSSDGPDWAVFMFVTGNGKGDYDGAKIWDFGGESYANDSRYSGKCEIKGYGA